MKKLNKGFAIHCHHDILVEYCYDYQERVKYIKKYKPRNEVKTRLKLFKLLPKEALKDIPKYYQEADRKCQEVHRKLDEAKHKWYEAHRKWQEVYYKYHEAHRKWPQKEKNAFHKKWCGCKKWKGKEIIFN